MNMHTCRVTDPPPGQVGIPCACTTGRDHDEDEMDLPSAEQNEQLPAVYCWVNGRFGDDQCWVALAEDGEVLRQHICSHESFAEHDLHSGFGRDKFAAKFGGFGDGQFYRLKWERPPESVLTAARERASAAR